MTIPDHPHPPKRLRHRHGIAPALSASSADAGAAPHHGPDPASAHAAVGRTPVTTFFTADTHFGHGGALGLFRRPFASVAAMDAALVARWNERVGPGDEVWHLGDFAVRRPADAVAALLDRLHGRKRLVAGNVDGPATRGLPGWESVVDYAEAEVEGLRLVLGHYPFRSWNGMGRGIVNLHGHSHGRLKPMARQLDVGVDAWNFRPASLAAIRERLDRRRPGS